MNAVVRNSIRSVSRCQWMVIKRNNETSCDAPPPAQVAGLSKKVVDVPCEEVGPGASKDGIYKNPEYYCYNNVSYFEAEVEMNKYRLPQPSNKS